MTKKSHVILSLFLLLTFSSLKSQITTGEFPPSFYSQKDSELSAIPQIEIRKPDLQKLQKIDRMESNHKDVPWRFGAVIPVSLNLSNSGEWFQEEGEHFSSWKLSLHAADAISINLNFDDFMLSEHAQLFIYNESYNDVLGAISKNNNKNDRQFSIRPIQGDQIFLELVVPSDEVNSNFISIHQVVYGYRDLNEKVTKSFNSSGNCNININCKEGDLWQEVKRSVAILTTSNNTRFCTGTLLNNVRQDSTPYLITAAHCGAQENSIFIFNYESSNCQPSIDGSLNHSISSGTTRAISGNGGSDFHLFELSSKPPLSYKVFYSGWSAVNEKSAASVTIHHPTGDVKKISIDTDSNQTSGFYDPNGDTHWVIKNWEKGTTETGSSGAPLFDQNLRMIGQLHGGDASCSSLAQDYFGKFSVSWDRGVSNLRQLKHWLDPDSLNITQLDGLDPNAATFQNDIQLLYLSGVPKYQCDSTISPSLIINNLGSDSLISLNINYSIDSVMMPSFNWTDTLQRNQLAEIPFPTISLKDSLHLIEVSAFFNAPHTDQDSSNNYTSFEFQTNSNPILVNFELKTDDYGEETSWAIFSELGIKLFEGGPYSSVNGGETIQKTFCLYDTCFSLELYDSFNDGFNGQFGNGYALITNAVGDTLSFENSFVSGKKTKSFCVSDTPTIIIENPAKPFALYPNPILRGERLIIQSSDLNKSIHLKLLDISGRLIYEFNTSEWLIPQNMARGIYILSIESPSLGNNPMYKKIIVK